MAQTEDQYPFATVYEQELGFYSFRQETLTNAQWYERFNTKIDVGEAIGVTRQHKVLLEYVAQEMHAQTFATLSAAEQEAVRTDAEERYISYAFLRQSGNQHKNLKVDLQNDFTTGDNRYPKTRQQTLHLLDKYSKTVVPTTTQSEGASFAQKGGKGGKSGGRSKETGTGSNNSTQKPYDKEYWKDKECFKCHKKGHPSSHCTTNDEDAQSRASQASSVKKLAKELKSIKKAFTQLSQTREDASDISDSDPSEGESHFQLHDGEFQFTQVENEFEPPIAKLFKQRHEASIKLDLRQVILLDSQSTMDLICNPALVSKTFRSSKNMRLTSNGGTMVVTHKATMPGYHTDVWFDKKAITNILALRNVIKQYRVTYDSDDQMFVVHRESANKPNMQFRMHESGLHYYDPRQEEFVFVTTVSGNKEGFMQRQIKGAEAARTLYSTLSYPSWNDFKWVIRSNQIKDCPVTVEDIDVALKIWGKNIAALKGKTVRIKPIPVITDFVKVPKELMKLHKEVGHKIIRRSWDVIPMPDTVIARVNALGHDQPEQLIFTDRRGRIMGDTDGTDVAIPGVDSDEMDPDDDSTTVNGVDLDVDNEDIPGVHPVELPGVDMEGVNMEPLQHDHAADIVGIDDLDTPAPDPPPIQVETVEPTATVNEPAVPVSAAPRRSTCIKAQPQTYTPSFTGTRYSYAVTQQENYGVLNPDAHMFVQEDFYQAEPDVVAAIMTQLSLKSGLKEWGDKAYEAVESEMKQLHFRNTFKPMHWSKLTDTQRKTVLESHLFLKEKRDGKIKGRTVAGGNKQRDYISKEDASSPTVATESVLLSCIIDAEEGRDVAVVDIPNAFIQTRIEDEKDMAIIKLRGVLVDILVEIAPDVYKSYATTDKKGVRQLVVQCQNALYGTMVASLLFYRKFTKSLIEEGFELNPYDPCVANKMIEGKQMTICFHVDDCKLSHRKPKVMDQMIEWLRKEYESIFEDGSGKMTVSRGKVHTYLGMTLDYRVRGQVKISMIGYIDEILAAFDKADPKGGGTKTSAAPENLFRINEDCKKLEPDKSVQFHNLVAKSLFATKRARPDTCTSVAFLTTRVRAPDMDDWAKLVHLMKYLRGTRTLPLILSANGSGIMKWWVDASFAVHPNMRGHSGGGLSLGRGFPITSSTKQKLNTRSSTETEIVGADDFMPAICWTRYFMEAQGYHVRDNVLFQDNKSAILLEKNGKASSSKRTKHINIRYFFITDRVNKGDISLAWCPTADMVGDFMTKPLQGALFRKFRDQIMGVVPSEGPDLGKNKSGNDKTDTRNVPPRKGVTKKNKFGAPRNGSHHRSVLEEVEKRTKNGLSLKKTG